MSKSDKESNPVDLSRRKFLGKSIGATAAVSIAPGVVLYDVAQAKANHDMASSKNRWGMLIDSNKCKSDCDKCVTACAKENGWDHQPNQRAETKVQWIRKVDLKDKATGHQTSLPVMCQHCEHPPCVDVCPTGASFKRNDGIVLVDKHICIGCRFCMMACPYKARSFVHGPVEGRKWYIPRGMGTVESCTMCVHRIDRDKIPACAEACPEGAIVFGDLKDPYSDISRRLAKYPSTAIREDLELNPGLRYEGI